MTVSTRTNLLPNPSFALDTTGWSAVSNCSIARSAGTGYGGSDSLTMTTASAGTAIASWLTGTSAVPTTVGHVLTAQARVKTATASRSASIALTWWTSGGAGISTSTGSSVALTANAWGLVTVTATAPATAAYVTVAVNGLSASAANEVFHVSQVLLERAATALDYFDGETTNALWSGKRYYSTSTLYSGAPTLAVKASWTTGPDETPSWSTLTTVEEASVEANGRSYELDAVTPTRADIRVDSSTSGIAPFQRTNLCKNPSFELTTTGWSAVAGATLSRSTATQYWGAACLSAVTSGSAQSGASYTISAPPLAAEMTVSMYVLNPAGTVTGIRLAVSGAVESATSTSTATVGSWVRISITFTTSPVSGSVTISVVEHGAASSGNAFFVDAVLIECASAAGTYFDGSLTVYDTNPFWNGSAHLSSSGWTGDYTIDKQIRILADDVPLFTGVTDSAPKTLDSGPHDYSTTGFSAIDYWDALGCYTIKSPMVMQTLEQSPTSYFILDERPGTVIAADQIAKTSAFVIHLGNPGGAFAFGGTSLLDPRSDDPTTSLALAPNPANDGGYAVQIGSTGFGAHVSGTQWTVRAVGETAYQNGGVLYCQVNSTSAGDALNKAVMIFFYAGKIYGQFPSGGTSRQISTSASTYCDGNAHTVELRALASSVQLVVDGTVAATYGSASDSITTNGPVLVGAAAVADLTGGSLFLTGNVGHIATFGSSYAGSVAVTVPDSMRKAYAGETPATRLARVLDWVGFTGATSLDTGSVALGPHACSGVSAADDVLGIAEADDGVFFFDGSGTAVFRAGSTRYSGTSTFVLGLPSTPVDLTGLTFEQDRQHLVNDIDVTRPGGPTFNVTSPSSITDHRRRSTGSPITFQVNSDSDLLTRANTYLNRYAWPRTRVGEITLDPFTAPALVAFCQTVKSGDRITITNLPDAAPAPTLDFIVESVAHTKISLTAWTVALQLSPFYFA